ncbi:MAG: class I SAM-dependent methyltransferase [Notoacmeibacter sp.]|nr:class I SAM-dependent methyltransferase [Notoacmeibacter sp.]MCC0033112.1 class I SAM-dependent methyltransferase [Brucellaceae bacterium]
MSNADEDAFRARREDMKARIEPLDRDAGATVEDRKAFFDAVYDMADGDEAAVPWADLQPKPQLLAWLAANPGAGARAIDIACGLGDNAEALAAAGYATTAFDLSQKAVDWAKRRFPQTNVDYHAANLMEPPQDWTGGFDLVHECYTIQSVPPVLHADFSRAIAGLLATGGRLLVYTRLRAEGSPAEGPPWPLTPSESGIFRTLGFVPEARSQFDLERPDRIIPHEFSVWRKVA